MISSQLGGGEGLYLGFRNALSNLFFLAKSISILPMLSFCLRRGLSSRSNLFALMTPSPSGDEFLSLDARLVLIIILAGTVGDWFPPPQGAASEGRVRDCCTWICPNEMVGGFSGEGGSFLVERGDGWMREST